ncbi:MAG: ABC transporter permease subunit [Actinomycetota bacterium]
MSTATVPGGGGRRLSIRARLTIGLAAGLVWAVLRAGVDDEVVNVNGWPSFASFWAALARPELGREFLTLTADAAAVTLSFAVLGTAAGLVIGALGGIVLSERLMGRTPWWWSARALFAVPRSVHELLWALIFVQVLGFDPLVAVLAIGVPFGAITAKVYAEAFDNADPAAYRTLRATGAGRITALAYGLVPNVAGELTSYSFYRLECAIRSAAVLGVIGAGGLGFQLDLSFETLRYAEIWTLIVALMILSGLADAWSSAVRRATGVWVNRVSLLGIGVLVPLAWWWVELDPRRLFSERTRRLGLDVVDQIVPPRLGPGGWGELIDASIDTVALTFLAMAISASVGLVAGAVTARPVGLAATRSADARGRDRLVGLGQAAVRQLLRLVLLLLRAVPAPMWAFLMVLVLFPGLWPGAVALGLYNLGVLGRLYAEIFEERDTGPGDVLLATGSSAPSAFFYGTLPAASPRLVSMAFYRSEVMIRESVVVGVVGAGGLGRLIAEHLAARDLAAVAGAIIVLVLLALAIDVLSAGFRRQLLAPPS